MTRQERGEELPAKQAKKGHEKFESDVVNFRLFKRAVHIESAWCGAPLALQATSLHCQRSKFTKQSFSCTPFASFRVFRGQSLLFSSRVIRGPFTNDRSSPSNPFSVPFSRPFACFAGNPLLFSSRIFRWPFTNGRSSPSNPFAVPFSRP